MLNRQKSNAKDIRSRIKHENVHLGAGTEMGGQPANQGLHNNTFVNHAPAYRQQDFFHQAHPLGAGPSFVSLSPSDSISNFEGRPGGTMAGGMGQLFEPSAASTASFAQGLAEPPTPLRPARSVRRPQQQMQQQRALERSIYQSTVEQTQAGRSASPLGQSFVARNGGPSYNNDVASDANRPVNRHARSARLMAQVMNQEDGRITPNSIQSEEDSALDHIDEADSGADERQSTNFKSYDSQMTVSPPLGSLSRSEAPAALGSVLDALTHAGRKKGQARILRGTTAEEESRRRKSERKVEKARTKEAKPLEYYVDRNDERPFREICAVLRKVTDEWGFVVEDDFNSVALALSLLDESSLGASRREFSEVKVMIERALQGTVDDHYESFATAISLHNNVLSSLGSAQNGVSASRRRLRDAREALGAKRADLVQLWQRSQVVKDSLRLLDTIENLKSVPDRLESLMSEKRFLEAVNLLMRSLKVIKRPEIAEVGATADLSGYLKGQEQAMFDILIEELHNHLYLKSIFCDSRWKPYVSGQSTIPNVYFGQEYDEAKAGTTQSDARPEEEANEQGQERARGDELKLFQYLKFLANRPSYDPEMATDVPDLSAPDAFSGTSSGRDMNFTTLTASQSSESNTALASDGQDSLQNQSPEADSFLYIEMLLESLARLGKLKLTQEILQQRLTIELHQLVDYTIDEVDSRNELLRRSSVMIMRPESLLLSNSSALARSFAESTRSSFRNSSFGRSSTSFGTSLGSTSMRLSTSETSQMERDNETMRDLFWTLFSKLDAVLQGHRVVFEVVTKISSRGASSAYKAVKIGKPSSLIEVWKPIQAEVRTLLFEHLMDDAESTSARRNVLVSVNEVLRQGNFQRDHSKPLFKLVAESAPKPGVNLSRKDFAPLRRHEEALTNALRASVPGLVGAMDSTTGTGAGVSIANFQHQPSIRTTALFANAGGHKLLVKPDAFNISVLFQPALAFIERVKILLPAEASGESDSDRSSSSGKGFSRFLDEFVKDVFLSQLEDKVYGLLTAAVGGPDAFQEDVNTKGQANSRPIVRSATNVIVLIDSLYSMLRTTPFQRKSYSHLIIQTIVQYYQHCHERFRDLVSNDVTAAAATAAVDDRGIASVPTFAISATWAQTPMIATCLVEAVRPDCQTSRRKHLFDLEDKLELGMAAKATGKNKQRGSITLSDLTTSRKKLNALCNLQNSMVWFYEHIQKLKATDEDVATSAKAVARLSLINRVQPALTIREGEEESIEDELKLPLNKDMAIRFAALPKTFEHLSHIILFTLRVEIRARTIHYIDLAIHEGNYVIEDVVLEPDPQIVDLNAELASLDDIFADTLLPQYHSFLFAGLASFMDLQLCQAIRKIRFINRHGLTKMIRNILALQQNLRNIVVIHESSSHGKNAGTKQDSSTPTSKHTWLQASADGFERSTKLWELVGKEPEQMLAWIRSEGPMHSFEDYRSALNLMLGLENGSATQSNSPNSIQSAMFAATSSGGPLPPGAHLKPGTTSNIAGDVSRQKLNEYLIELHEVAGEAL